MITNDGWKAVVRLKTFKWCFLWCLMPLMPRTHRQVSTVRGGRSFSADTSALPVGSCRSVQRRDPEMLLSESSDEAGLYMCFLKINACHLKNWKRSTCGAFRLKLKYRRFNPADVRFYWGFTSKNTQSSSWPSLTQSDPVWPSLTQSDPVWPGLRWGWGDGWSVCVRKMQQHKQ